MVNDKALIKNEHWVDMCRDGLGCMHKIKTPFRARVLTRLGGLCGRLMRKRFFTLTSYDLHLSSDSECWNDNLSVFCNCWREKKIPGSMRRSKLHVEYELPTIRPHAYCLPQCTTTPQWRLHSRVNVLQLCARALAKFRVGQASHVGSMDCNFQSTLKNCLFIISKWNMPGGEQ